MSSCAAIERLSQAPVLGPVVELDPLVQAVAEDVLRELAVRAHVGREHVDVVEPLHRRAASDVALRLVPPRRPQMLGRLVPLGLVEELEDVPVGIGEAVRRAVTDVAVDPPRPEPGRLDRGDAPLERLGAPRAQRDVAEPGLRRLRELQAVAQVVAPAAQVDRLAPRAPPPPCPSTSTKKRRLSSGFGVRSSA